MCIFTVFKNIFLEPEETPEVPVKIEEVPVKIEEQVPIEEGFGDIFNKQSCPEPDADSTAEAGSIDQGILRMFEFIIYRGNPGQNR